MDKPKKIRLDTFLVEQGFFESRARAQAAIMAGQVLVDEQKIDKPGTAVKTEAKIRLLGDQLKYVSRGGLKLEKALQVFPGLCPAERGKQSLRHRRGVRSVGLEVAQ